MIKSIDQVFVNAKHWLLSWLAGWPNWATQVVSSLINILALLAVFLTLFALLSVLERKILARIQNRYGPNRVGPYGLFQPIADGLKMLSKEDIVPRAADQVLHFLAPIMLVIPALLVYSVLPMGRNMAPADLDIGVIFFFAIGAIGEVAVFVAEYLSAIALSGLAVTLFLGGWRGPVLPSYLWFLIKAVSLIFLMIWIRGTLPRLRSDQLMGFAWKFMLPMSLLNILATGLWY